MSPDRPNILFIHSDQHRADCLGSAGHPFLRTPHLDRLAEEGIRYVDAFCPVPVCTPARISLLTGQWSFQHRCLANWDTEVGQVGASHLPSFSRQLREAGYHVGGVGKWHAGSWDGPEAYGFHEFVNEKRYVDWRREQGLPPPCADHHWFGDPDTAIRPEQSRLAWGARETVRLLGEARERGSPFFLRWDPVEPHLPNRPPEPYASLYPPGMIPPWPTFGETFEGKPFIQKQQLVTWGIEEWTWKEWARIVSLYLGEIALLDAQIGVVLAALETLGLADNTLVVYSSDHGDMCGGHRMIDKHFVMYEELIKVPLILRWPGRIASGQTSDRFVCAALDLASTFCEVAGVEIPSSFAGESLLPAARGEAEGPGRQDLYAAYHGNQFGLFSQRMVRDRRWKYVWNLTAEDELYDLETDPAELRNRAADPACRDELRRLRGRTRAWMEQTADPLLNEWTRAQLQG